MFSFWMDSKWSLRKTLLRICFPASHYKMSVSIQETIRHRVFQMSQLMLLEG